MGRKRCLQKKPGESVNTSEKTGVLLTGVHGGNPLGFLTALGTLAVVARSYEARLSWVFDRGQWIPVLTGGPSPSDGQSAADALLDYLDGELRRLPLTVFQAEQRMPFAAARLRELLLDAVRRCTGLRDRRDLDLLAAFGSEVVTEQQNFVTTAFRMTRAADSAGNGFTAYVVKIRRATRREHLERALFRRWDYADDFSSLRWDPIEEARYALRWRDPSKSPNRTMLGANSLAVEALVFYPTTPVAGSLVTTGFSEFQGETYFTWPIWYAPLDSEAIRSLVAFPELHRPSPDRAKLEAMGVIEVMRSRRFAPDKYYKNFSPAQPA